MLKIKLECSLPREHWVNFSCSFKLQHPLHTSSDSVISTYFYFNVCHFGLQPIHFLNQRLVHPCILCQGQMINLHKFGRKNLFIFMYPIFIGIVKLDQNSLKGSLSCTEF
jgi:hypothetical protein